MLLAVDVGADRVLRFREARLLGWRHRAVLERILLHRLHSGFLLLELRGLVRGQLAALQALLDALLLVDVALDSPGSVLGERRARKERADGKREGGTGDTHGKSSLSSLRRGTAADSAAPCFPNAGSGVEDDENVVSDYYGRVAGGSHAGTEMPGARSTRIIRTAASLPW